MMCEHCNKREAVVHVVEAVNGKQTELHLCQECAEKMQMKFGFKTVSTELVNSFFEPFSAVDAARNHVCSKCGTRYSDFTKTGYLGCPDCYREFRALLPAVILKMQGKDEHVGKIPLGYDSSFREKKQYEALSVLLKKAVAEERYEDAAKINAQMNQLGVRRNGSQNQ